MRMQILQCLSKELDLSELSEHPSPLKMQYTCQCCLGVFRRGCLAKFHRESMELKKLGLGWVLGFGLVLCIFRE